jgi:hypothetical protein
MLRYHYDISGPDKEEIGMASLRLKYRLIEAGDVRARG